MFGNIFLRVKKVFGNIFFDNFLAVDNTEIGRKNRIPLWMFGMMY